MNSEETYRFITYTDPESDMPWTCRLREISRSPKGKVVSFEAIDATKHPVVKFPSKVLPPTSKVEALREFQRGRIHRSTFSNPNPLETDLYVRQIVKAQKLIDKMLFCPSI